MSNSIYMSIIFKKVCVGLCKFLCCIEIKIFTFSTNGGTCTEVQNPTDDTMLGNAFQAVSRIEHFPFGQNVQP